MNLMILRSAKEMRRTERANLNSEIVERTLPC